MVFRIVVLNGGSSSGKTSVARSLQSLLPDPWLVLGVDTLIDAMPASLWGSADGITVDSEGRIGSGAAFRTLEAAWSSGVAAIARAGVSIILDEVWLDGAAGQVRWQTVLEGIPTFWVGIRCDPTVAARREANRGDRVRGMAVAQANLVHRGVCYDLEIDTTDMSPDDCAKLIQDRLASAAH